MKNITTTIGTTLALLLCATAHGEIYKSENADGTTVFTDSPPSADAQEVELQQSNIADAVKPRPTAAEAAPAPQPSPEKQPGQTIVIEGDQALDNEGEIVDPYLVVDEEARRKVRLAEPRPKVRPVQRAH